jgi:predicted ATPase
LTVYLKSVRRKHGKSLRDGFPFDVPAIAEIDDLDFPTPITFFVGSNGSGKSTLLEALAASYKMPSLGSAQVDAHPLMAAGRELSRDLTLVRERRPKRAFFFRADDVLGYVMNLKHDMSELERLEQEFDANLEGYGRILATGSARGQRKALEARYGEHPHARSHGELFLHLLQSRMLANGLYLLDEPETPFSPILQLALLALVMDVAQDGAQLVIATHSPILMAAPGASIYSFDEHPPALVEWGDVEHVTMTRAFLNDPEGFLKHLGD